jgi:hypothetical protein
MYFVEYERRNGVYEKLRFKIYSPSCMKNFKIIEANLPFVRYCTPNTMLHMFMKKFNGFVPLKTNSRATHFLAPTVSKL